jgi:hypothetical protein
MQTTSYPFKDYDFIGDRYVNIESTTSECGEIMWYERDIDRNNTPTECLICIQAENEMYTKYAHPKAHLEAHIEAGKIAEKMAIEKKDTTDYIDYYTIYFSSEYRRIYTTLYKKYKEEYSRIVLERKYEKGDKICNYHNESIQYHYELR